MRLAALCIAAGAALGCVSVDSGASGIAHAEADSDFESYHLRRVGLVPFAGQTLDREHARVLQAAFLHEFAINTDFEIVMLEDGAMEEVVESHPYRRGRLKPLTVLELSKRYSLDGILMGTVTHVNAYPPQVLGVEMDLIACETGLPIWSSRIQMDASDVRVRNGLTEYARKQERTGAPRGDSLALISPTRFARYAAYEVAQTLPQ